MSRRLTLILALGAALTMSACKKKDAPPPAADAKQDTAKKPEKPAPTKKDEAKPKVAPGGDPTGGKFTLEEATEGLEGEGKLMATFETKEGNITCELFPDKAPVTVASFVGLARGKRPYRDNKTGEWTKGPYFDGLAFHRVIPEFMIQGGDSLSRDYNHPGIGTGGPGYTVPDEVAPGLIFDKPGRLAMANKGPGTRSGGSQFFITEVPRPSLNGGYAIFGQCDNIDVVKTIARVDKIRPGGSKPKEPLTMKVVISRK